MLSIYELELYSSPDPSSYIDQVSTDFTDSLEFHMLHAQKYNEVNMCQLRSGLKWPVEEWLKELWDYCGINSWVAQLKENKQKKSQKFYWFCEIDFVRIIFLIPFYQELFCLLYLKKWGFFLIDAWRACKCSSAFCSWAVFWAIQNQADVNWQYLHPGVIV